MRLPWQTRHAPAIAFALLALVGGIGLKAAADRQTNQLYQSQLASCHRNNSVRIESNRRIASHKADTEVLREFLAAARDARVASYERRPTKGDSVAIEEYGHLIKVLDAKVKFSEIPLIDCKVAIPKP